MLRTQARSGVDADTLIAYQAVRVVRAFVETGRLRWLRPFAPEFQFPGGMFFQGIFFLCGGSFSLVLIDVWVLVWAVILCDWPAFCCALYASPESKDFCFFVLQ